MRTNTATPLGYQRLSQQLAHMNQAGGSSGTAVAHPGDARSDALDQQLSCNVGAAVAVGTVPRQLVFPTPSPPFCAVRGPV